MNGVKVGEFEKIERALRRFKKVCDNAGVLSESRKIVTFEKPCDERRRKYKAAVRKRQLELKEEKYPRKRKRNNKNNYNDYDTEQ